MPIDKIKHLRGIGYTKKQIADKLNISKSSVEKYLRT